MNTSSILRQTWRDLSSNRGAALRIFGPAILISWIVPLIVSKYLSGQFSILLTFEITPYAPLSQVLIPAFGLFVIAWFEFSAAIAWHRLIILAQPPAGLMAQLGPQQFVPYLWRSFVWIVILILAALVAMMGFGRLVGPEALNTPLFNLPISRLTAFLLMLVLPISYLGLRLSPMLVAAALDQKMRMRSAWAKSSGIGTNLWIIAALFFAIFIADKFILQATNGSFLLTLWLGVTGVAWIILPPIFTKIFSAIDDQSAAK